MAPQRKVSERQMEILMDFAETNPDYSLGRLSSSSPLSSLTARQVWQTLAVQLNSVAKGCNKTSDQWRRYWIEYKARTRTKAADLRRSTASANGWLKRIAPLSFNEKRVIDLIRSGAEEGITKVWKPLLKPANPTPTLVALRPKIEARMVTNIETPANKATPQTDSADGLGSGMEVEWLDDVPPSLRETQPIDPLEPESHVRVTADVERLEHNTPQSQDQPEVATTQDRCNRSTASPTISGREPRLQRRVHRNNKAHSWVYKLELRRIATQERLATAVEQMVALKRLKKPVIDIKTAQKGVSTQIQRKKEINKIHDITERITSTTNLIEDEFDSFGKYIATTLRSMPQESAIIAKIELQKALSDIQLKIVRRKNEICRSNLPSPCASTSSDSDSCLSDVKIENDS